MGYTLLFHVDIDGLTNGVHLTPEELTEIFLLYISKLGDFNPEDDSKLTRDTGTSTGTTP